jgi:uncharacterized protein (TIGR00369 family)
MSEANGAGKVTPELLKSMASRRTIITALGIEVTETTHDRVSGTMPVNENTIQYVGFLHGGASVVLAETLASIGTFLHIDPTRQICFGTEINASHLRSRTGGTVTGVALPIYKGRTTMVWEIKISGDDGKLVCISRCTCAIVNRPTAGTTSGVKGEPE